MGSDYLKIGDRGYGKCYMSGLDGRTIELGKPIDLTYSIIDSAIVDLDAAADDAKSKATWHDPIIPNWFKKNLTESTFALPKNYIINDGATILFWKDGAKTVVKRSKDEKFDKRLGFLTAYFQKHCGMSKTKANKFLDNLEVEE